jgi:hypothetical protein
MYQNDNEGGITGYALHEKGGIPLPTWQDNYHNFEYFQLITEVKRELSVKKINSKRKTRAKYSFRITPIGLITLIRNLKIEDINQFMETPNIVNFLPLIKNHWSELSVIYANALPLIFKDTLQQLSLRFPEPQPRDSWQTKQIFLEIKFPIEEYYSDIVLREKFSFLTKKEIQQIQKRMDEGIESKEGVVLLKSATPYWEMKISIIEWFTFLFYYNLVKYFIEKLYYGQFFIELSNESFRAKTKHKDISQLISNVNNIITKEFDKDSSKNKEKIFAIIKNDSNLHKVFQKGINEVSKIFEKSRVIEIIEKI